MMADPPAGLVILVGQVCRVRALSKRLIFFDLLLSAESPRDGAAAEPTPSDAAAPLPPPSGAGSGSEPGGGHARERWVEVIAKASEWDGAQEARDAIR